MNVNKIAKQSKPSEAVNSALDKSLQEWLDEELPKMIDEEIQKLKTTEDV